MSDKITETVATLDAAKNGLSAVGSVTSLGGQTIGTVSRAFMPGVDLVSKGLNTVTRGVTGIFGESRDLIRNPVTEVGAQITDTSNKLFQFGVFDKLFAGVTFGVRAWEAGQEFHDGRHDKATGKIARGTVEAGVALFNLTGIGLVAQIGTKLATGKFASEHLGDFVEDNAVKAYHHFVPESKQIDKLNQATTAGVAMMPTGLQLAPNQLYLDNGQAVTIGQLPNSHMRESSIALQGQPVIPRQVMSVQYEPTLQVESALPTQNNRTWQSKITEQRQQHVAQAIEL